MGNHLNDQNGGMSHFSFSAYIEKMQFPRECFLIPLSSTRVEMNPGCSGP